VTIKLDRNVEAVLGFMDQNVEADKLIQVAEAVASLAPILWSRSDVLERCPLASFKPLSIREQLSTATQLDPVRECVGDGSEEEMGSQTPK
jgi:hypothetical protein